MNKSIVAASGEHYVAYRLSVLGYLVAFVRQGSPSIDLLIGTVDGGKSIGVQVKTTSNAIRLRGRGANRIPHELQFPLGKGILSDRAIEIIFCFVDLKSDTPKSTPDVYIIHGKQLFNEYQNRETTNLNYLRHHRTIEEMDPHKDNWDIIHSQLKA